MECAGLAAEDSSAAAAEVDTPVAGRPIQVVDTEGFGEPEGMC